MAASSQVPIRAHGRFEKGSSGNPGGRPARRLSDGRSLTDLARERTEEALLALVAVLKDKKTPAAARVSAAVALLDRGWGRPAQTILSLEHEVHAAALDPHDAAARIASLLSAARERKLAMANASPGSDHTT